MIKSKQQRREKHPLPQPGARKPQKYTFTDWACL